MLNPNRYRSWGRGGNWGWTGWEWREGSVCGENSLRHVLLRENAGLSRVQHCPHSQVTHLHRYHLPSANHPGVTNKRRTIYFSLGQGVEKSTLWKSLLSVDLSKWNQHYIFRLKVS